MYSRRALPLSVVAVAGALLAACAGSPPSQLPSQSSPQSTSESPLEHPETGHFACGQLNIEVNPLPDSPLIGIDYRESRLLLKPVPSSVGQMFRAPGDHRTQFHYQNERAELILRGEKLPPCLRPGALVLPFTGQGSEPAWRAFIEGERLVVNRPYAQDDPLSLALTAVTADRHGQTFQAQSDEGPVTLSVAAQLCEDKAAGTQFPYQAHLTVNGESFIGCGGDPRRLLEGAQWQVRELAGASLAQRSPVTIQFLDAGRVAGQSPCNGYQGRYQLTDGELVFSQLSTTRGACASAYMHEEDKFLELMGQVTEGRIGRGGELVLSTPDGVSILAVQSEKPD